MNARVKISNKPMLIIKAWVHEQNCRERFEVVEHLHESTLNALESYGGIEELNTEVEAVLKLNQALGIMLAAEAEETESLAFMENRRYE